MKKSILKLGLIALLGFTVVACGGNEGSSSSQPEQQTNEPDMLTKSVADLVETPYTKHTNIVKVQGVWVPTGKANDEYGNGLLADPTTGKTITIYGMAPTKDAFTYNFDEEVYTYKNPQKFQDLKNSFVAGDKIELGIGCYNTSFKNYMSYFISKVTDKAEIKYTPAITAGEGGAVTLDKAEYTYGEKMTATIAPAAGKKLNKLIFNGSAVEVSGTTVELTCSYVNKIEATFVDEGADTTLAAPYNLTMTELTGAANSYGEYTVADASANEFYVSCGGMQTGYFQLGLNKETNLAKQAAIPAAVDAVLGDLKATGEKAVNAVMMMNFDVKNVGKVSFTYTQIRYGTSGTTKYSILKSIDAGTTWSLVTTTKTDTTLEVTETEATKARYALFVSGDATSSAAAAIRLTNLDITAFGA